MMLVASTFAVELHSANCAFDSLLLASLPLGGKPVYNENCTKMGIVPDGGGCEVVKQGYTCGVLACVQGKFEKPTCAAKGCKFDSLQYKNALSKVLGRPQAGITEQAERATLDADVAVDNLEIGNNQSTIVIDPLAVVNGVQFSGVGCAANGSVSSGSSCTLEKVGWDCTKLTCTAEKWGQAICTASGCPFDTLLESLPEGGRVLGGVNCTSGGTVRHGSKCGVSKDGFTCSPAVCKRGKFVEPTCTSTGCKIETIKLPAGAIIEGDNCLPGKIVQPGTSCRVSIKEHRCEAVHCTETSASFSNSTCRPDCTVQGTCCSVDDLEDKMSHLIAPAAPNKSMTSKVGVICPGGGLIVEVGTACGIFMDGYVCPAADCTKGGFNIQKCVPKGCSTLRLQLPYGAKASGAGCSTGGSVQHGQFCKIELERHTCSAALCEFGRFTAPTCLSGGQTILNITT